MASRFCSRRSNSGARCVLVVALCAMSLCFAVRLSCGGGADVATTRIVCMVPNVTEILFAIGAGGQVVGDSDFCNYPEEARRKTRVGGLLNPNMEKIVSLRPGTVILLDSQSELARKLGKLGLATVTVGSDSLDDVFRSITEAGRLSGRSVEAAALLSSIRARIQAVRDHCSSAPRVRTLMIVGRQPAALQNIYAAGPKTYLGQLLEAAGADNVASGNGAAYVPMTKEQILSLNPSVIIDTSLGEAGQDPAVVAAHKKVWQQMPMVAAVRDNRIHYLTDPHQTIPGPGIVETLDHLAAILHPQTSLLR